MSVMIHSARAAQKLACPTVALPRNHFLLCLLLPLAGCGTTERMVVSSIPQDDYRVRHPIVLAERPRMLEILVEPETGRFDRHSAAQLRRIRQPLSQIWPGTHYDHAAGIGPVAHPPLSRYARHFFARERAAYHCGPLSGGSQPCCAGPVELSWPQGKRRGPVRTVAKGPCNW